MEPVPDALGSGEKCRPCVYWDLQETEGLIRRTRIKERAGL